MADGSNSNGVSLTKSNGTKLEKTNTVITIGKLKLRGQMDDLPQDWWFASTAIPLLAATIGPLANVLSIAALVSKWKITLANDGVLPEGADALGTPIPDPRWEIIMNSCSLACGFIGNFCLLLNFTRRIRYIIALPATIIFWFAATGLLIGTCAHMNNIDPPIRPGETYSQGFWHAIIASVLYLVGSMILMANMVGYFLGHYPQHFDLDEHQRTLILQTMMFFFWLAGGAAVFAKVCGWTYADALYFCDVTVLTIGFGDFYSTNDLGRGLVFPYSVLGIIFLGLMIKSIRNFASSMSTEKVIRKHQLNERERTFGRTVTSEKELRARLGLPPKDESRRPSSARKPSAAGLAQRTSLEQYGRFDVQGKTVIFHEHKAKTGGGGRGGAGRTHKPKAPLSRDAKMQLRAEGKLEHVKRAKKREKLIMLKEEKDRFNAMREIQSNTNRFKQYYALGWSAIAFGLLWCVGAAVFMIAEQRMQGMTYFQALYFCYVSLLTIGYGDLSPKSNAGKPFFIVWSLVAIPTMTILISAMGDTIVSSINRGTFTLADWTVMPKAGVWHDWLESHPKLRDYLAQKTLELQAKKRLRYGFEVQNPDEESGVAGKDMLDDKDDDSPNKLDTKLEKLAEEPLQPSDHELARKLALAIRRTAIDLRAEKKMKYTYEEWAEFTRLIRFSGHRSSEEVAEEEEEEGLLEWDWIGEDSPMLADVSESEWVLERLCESLNRYTRIQAAKARGEFVTPSSEIDDPMFSLSDNLMHENSRKRQRLHHDHHLNLYPAHPGPRSGGSRSHGPSDDKTPVFVRDANGDEILRVKLRAEYENEDRLSGSGSGSGSGTTAVAASDNKDDDPGLGEKEEVFEDDSDTDGVVSTAKAVDFKRISIG